MTHREQINNMSNEELAEFLHESNMCHNCIYDDVCCDIYISEPCCNKGIEAWLNMEVEE